jgi:hypothetical protein
MSRRPRAIAFPVSKAIPLTDKSKLLWSQYYGPAQAAAQQMNAAFGSMQNILARIIIESQGLDADTHLFDMDKLVIVPRPKGEGNGA